MYGRVRLVLVFALCASAGCSGCNKPSGGDENTPQGQRLRELFDNGKAMPVTTESETPFTFEPIKIDHNEKDGKGFYQARLAWEYTGKDRSLADYLKERMQRNTHELNMGIGRLAAFRLLVDYGIGEPDEVDVPLGGKSGGVVLEKFCATDKPRSVTVSLRSATWVEDGMLTPCLALRPGEGKVVAGKLMLVAPGELPIRFEDCLLETGESGPAPAPRTSWRLVGEPAALAQRAAALTEWNPRLVGREVKSLRLLLGYRDRAGRSLGNNEEIVLDFTARQGTLALAGLRRADGLDSVVMYAVSITWNERVTRVPLTK